MSKADEFRKHLQTCGLSLKNINFSVSTFEEFEEYLKKRKESSESMNLSDLKAYISLLIAEEKNSEEKLDAVARCLLFAKKFDEFVYLEGTYSASNVLPDIGDRLSSIAGEDVRHRVFEAINLPALGSPQDLFPPLTAKMMKRMEAELPHETCKHILTWNYHRIPDEAFRDSKERLQKANSIDEYLKGEHKRLADQMEACMKKGQMWFEQEITPDVLEFVKNNQEIITGVRKGDKIFTVKIPYSPKQFLKENDPKMKRYYACHCQLARTAIRDGTPKISPNFCYCSAGYVKAKFDAVFDEPVEIELLESALKGDVRCRFAVKIPKGKMK